MVTYGLTKDYRYWLYIVITLVALLIDYTLNYFVYSKINVDNNWQFIVSSILSVLSFGSLATIFVWIIDKLYIKFNKINGKYALVIESDYDEGTIVEGVLCVKVGLLKAKITLETAKSKSISKTVFIDNEDKDDFKITYTYNNNGNQYRGNKLYKHDGTCELTFENNRIKEGHYYNNIERKTCGTLVMK